MTLLPTPSQTVGPFFHDSMFREPLNVLVRPGAPGQPIRVEGHVYDGEAGPVDDAMIEIWQANGDGRYRHPADLGSGGEDEDFLGFGRAATDEQGRYWFETIKPGPVRRGSNDAQAPHLNLHVFARGLLDSLVTRLYFGDEQANAADPVLNRIETERRSTLVAKPARRDDRLLYLFDIVLQGDGETVFFCPR